MPLPLPKKFRLLISIFIFRNGDVIQLPPAHYDSDFRFQNQISFFRFGMLIIAYAWVRCQVLFCKSCAFFLLLPLYIIIKINIVIHIALKGTKHGLFSIFIFKSISYTIKPFKTILGWFSAFLVPILRAMQYIIMIYVIEIYDIYILIIYFVLQI